MRRNSELEQPRPKKISNTYPKFLGDDAEKCSQVIVSRARVPKKLSAIVPRTGHFLAALQRTAGNRAVVSLLRQAEDEGLAGETGNGSGAIENGEEQIVQDEIVSNPDSSLPVADGSSVLSHGGFVDAGITANAAVGDTNEDEAADRPQLFLRWGQRGTIAFTGGGDPAKGPHGNELSGSVYQNPPRFEARGPDASGRFNGEIAYGTGSITVVRSYTGAQAGSQGNGWFVTDRAAARMNEHEQLHVNASEGAHDMFLGPLEARLADPALGQNNSDTAHAAKVIHRSKIGWSDSVRQFINFDRVTNTLHGIVDATEKDSPTYIEPETGPFTYSGMFFEHLLRRRDEPRPEGFNPIRR